MFDAQNAISTALHIDPQSLRPVVLEATSLTDAIQTTLSEFNQSLTSETAADLHGSLTTVSTDSYGTASSASLFDDTARRIVEQFIQDTPQIKVEVVGNDFLLVDMDRSHYGSGQQVLETWTMSDGSTLSIIGIVPHQLIMMQYWSRRNYVNPSGII